MKMKINTERNIICKNCLKKGHHIRDCTEPRVSFGVIAYHYPKIPPGLTYVNIDKVKLLMICRKHTISLIDFIRGKYNLYDYNYLLQLFERMTNKEKNLIKSSLFSDLWFYVWNKSVKNTRYLMEYYKSYEKFLKLKNDEIYVNRKLVNIDILIKKSGRKYKEPEWIFPKGKREKHEDDLTTAKREFEEETSVDKNRLTYLDKYIEEIYEGSDYIYYKNKYYVGHTNKKIRVKINKDLACQAQEVSKISWVSFSQAYKNIRPYYKEKLKTLNKVKEIIVNYYLDNKQEQDNLDQKEVVEEEELVLGHYS